MAAAVPAVEAADHRDAPGVGRPDGETHALYAVHLDHLGAEHPADLPMVAFGEQVHVQLAELWAETVGIFSDLFPARPANLQKVGLLMGQSSEEETRYLPLLHHRQQLLVAVQQLHTERVGQVGPYHHSIAVRVRSEHGEGIAMFGSYQGVHIGIAGHQGLPWRGQNRAINHWNLHRKAVVPGPAVPVAGRATRPGGSPLRKRSRTRISPG